MRNRPVPSQGLNIYSGASSQKDGVILASAARAAATYTSGEYFASDVRGLRIYIDITNANGGSLVLKLQTKDPSSGNWVDVAGAVTAALGSNATTVLILYPSVAESANVDISDPIGTSWRISVTVSTATMTFSVGGEYLI